VLLDRTPPPAKSERISVLEPLRALRHREIRGSALTSAFYNFGFFTLLAYTPLALGLGAHELGYVFFGWGLMLAIFAVFVARRSRDGSATSTASRSRSPSSPRCSWRWARCMRRRWRSSSRSSSPARCSASSTR
jgi:hypothetical protein